MTLPGPRTYVEFKGAGISSNEKHRIANSARIAKLGVNPGEPQTVFSPGGLPRRPLSGGKVLSGYEAKKRKLVGEKW